MKFDEVAEAKKLNDFLDMDGDGNKKEPHEKSCKRQGS